MSKLIEINDLSVTYSIFRGNKKLSFNAVDHVSLSIEQGEVIGIIGESGSGKSTLAMAMLRLIQQPGEITSGEVIYCGKDILRLDMNALNDLRWKEISTVFQAAQNSLNPLLKISTHFEETYIAHNGKITDMKAYKEKIKRLFGYVRLDEKLYEMYPFEISGGQKQRVMIALSLLLDPKLIILDEPTTALDVINQWYILGILKVINEELKVTFVFLTHDISVIRTVVDRVVVMYAGQIVEIAPANDFYSKPQHPYSCDLINAIPSLHDKLGDKKRFDLVSKSPWEYSDHCRYFDRCTRAQNNGCQGEAKNCSQLTNTGNSQVLCNFRGDNN